MKNPTHWIDKLEANGWTPNRIAKACGAYVHEIERRRRRGTTIPLKYIRQIEACTKCERVWYVAYMILPGRWLVDSLHFDKAAAARACGALKDDELPASVIETAPAPWFAGQSIQEHDIERNEL